MISDDVPRHRITDTILRITCLFWLMAKLIGWKVWLAYRLFPIVPPFDFLHLPNVAHLILFLVSIIGIIAIIFVPNNKILLVSFLIVELSSCLLDQNRWQPWEYQYLFTLLIFILNRNKQERIIPSIAFMLIATYCYSSINKFNDGFLFSVWDNMILRYFLKIKEAYIEQHLIHYCGYLLALIELTGGIGLLFKRTRETAATILIAMHLLNLIILGPIGLHYNKIIWPWNVAMIILLWIVFIKNEQTFSINLLWKKSNKLVLFCWGALPALNFIGCWDNYLSCNLYSGHIPLMAICVQDSSNIPTVEKYFNKKDALYICNGGRELNIQNWAMAEMNVPPYPEVRVYQEIKKDWLKKYPTTDANFILFNYPPTEDNMQEMK